MAGTIDLSGAKRRIVDHLKRVESMTAPELALEFGLTDTAIRQHIDVLAAAGLVEPVDVPHHGRGRPPVHWRLTSSADALFADHHGDLAIDLLATIRSVLGDDALHAVIGGRARSQREHYMHGMERVDTLEGKVQTLARMRSAEGYLAEAVTVDGALSLVQHHCPIRGAAGACGALCSTELDLFRSMFAEATIERDQHLLSGGQRCSYIVTPA